VLAQDAVSNPSAPSPITYTVAQAAPVITWANPGSITYGTALSGTQLNATANVGGTFAYTPAAGTVLTAGTQTLSATFTPADTTDYTTATSMVSIIVGKATPVITWTNPGSITYGTALSGAQLDASSTVAGTFAYTPAAGTILTAGTQTLSVTLTPTDTTDYATATTSVTIMVGKATPVITWANPASIAYGTPLTATQLSAAANVAGTFLYAPAAGSILGVGPQTLSTTFTPNDAVDYTGATKTVPLTVTQASTTTTITSVSPNPALPGNPVMIAVSVTGSTNASAPTGTVTVKASTGETCSAAVSAGGCSLTFATVGTRTVTASYSGDSNFMASSTTAAVQVNVGDFSISATPSSETISSGHNAAYTITVMPIGGLTGSVNLSCSGGPPNSTCSVSPAVANLQGGGVNSTVTLASNKNVNHGTFTLTFTGSYGGLVHSVSVSLTVKGQS
jgi:hypothetical protein